MFTENLFDEVLIRPVQLGADQIHIVSGYATAAMAFSHINYLRNQGHGIIVNLIVGMCPNDGLSICNHNGFKKLMEDDFAGTFNCSYIKSPPPVHSKVYAWSANSKPIFGFAGSANYTQNAFRSKQKEVMAPCNAEAAQDYFQQLYADTIACTHKSSEELIQLFNKKNTNKKELILKEEKLTKPLPDHLTGLQELTVSLLGNDGNLPRRSGLNWGQRPDQNRDPNQAYIRLPASVYHSKFFPELTVQFTVLTDDGKTMICTRAQQNGKAIHTPHDNSLIGKYFRNRLGLATGALVTETDLFRYGRSDITFHKIDDETYFLDFSP